jgi:hypothetical protein
MRPACSLSTFLDEFLEPPHFAFAFRSLIAMPSRVADFRIDTELRPVFFAIAFKSFVLDISISARSDAIVWP